MLARSIGDLAGLPGLHRNVPRLKPPRPRTNIAQRHELAAMLANAEPWLRVFLTLLAALGLRHAEALDIRPIGFNPERHVVHFTAKGGETQEMPTTEEVEALFANAPQGDPLTPLVALYRGKPVKQSTVWWAWSRLKKKARITSDLIPHDLRRTAAVAGYELTKDLRFVWQLLRHRNLSTTARYLEHVNPTEMRALLAELWKPRKETVQ